MLECEGMILCTDLVCRHIAAQICIFLHSNRYYKICSRSFLTIIIKCCFLSSSTKNSISQNMRLTFHPCLLTYFHPTLNHAYNLIEGEGCCTFSAILF